MVLHPHIHFVYFTNPQHLLYMSLRYIFHICFFYLFYIIMLPVAFDLLRYILDTVFVIYTTELLIYLDHISSNVSTPSLSHPIVATSACLSLPPLNYSEAEGLYRGQEEFIEEKPLSRVSSRCSTRSRTSIFRETFSMWDDQHFNKIECLRTSMITETNKLPLLDHYHHGETYIKGVWYLALPVERKYVVGAFHNLADKRRSILGVHYY